PKEVKAESGEASVYLVWKPVEGKRLAGYRVFRAESEKGPFLPAHLSPVTSACFEDRGLSAKSVYFYRVCALDRDLNPSRPTTPVSISTTFPPLRDWPKKTKSPLSQVTVCDVDGDGDLEIASGDRKGGIWIWHHTGAELRHGGDNWTFGLFKEMGEGAFAPTFADLDGDGKMEVLSAGRHGDRKVHALRLDGEPVPGWPKPVKGRLMTPPQVADLDGDGSPEIVFHEGFGRNMYVWRKDGSALNTQKKKGKVIPKDIIGQTDPFTYWLSTLADLDGDGKKEIIGIGGRGNVYAFKIDGTKMPGFPYKAGGPLGSTAPVGDLDGNGRPEVVFVAKGGTELFALEWDGAVRKELSVKVSKSKPGEGQSIPILADLDGKKGLEIVLGGRDGRLFVVDGQGKNLPGFPVRLPKEACGSAVGDLDGDSTPEIVVGCRDGNLYAFDPDGKPLRGFPLRTGGPVLGVPVITDIDGDGDVDILAASSDAYVHIWDLSAQHDPGKVSWPMYGGNPCRTGVPFPPPETPRSVSVQGTTSARIMWRPPKARARTKIEAFHVYRGQGGLLGRISKAPLKKPTFLDKDIVPGRLYAYSVTCIDSNGRESSLAPPIQWGEEKVSALFSKAEKFEKRKKYKEAIRTFSELLKTFPESRFADPARARLERLRSDEGVQADLDQRKIDGWCRGMLGLARTWEKSGKTSKASDCYRKIIERYPNTSWAEKARKAMKALEGK
ncbi:MAG: FG-GAP-like repeat-containing protein, partial [Planctomycetota bacterium]